MMNMKVELSSASFILGKKAARELREKLRARRLSGNKLVDLRDVVTLIGPWRASKLAAWFGGDVISNTARRFMCWWIRSTGPADGLFGETLAVAEEFKLTEERRAAASANADALLQSISTAEAPGMRELHRHKALAYALSKDPASGLVRDARLFSQYVDADDSVDVFLRILGEYNNCASCVDGANSSMEEK